MSSLPSRRTFLKATGAGAAALSLSAVSYANVVGANDRIAIGVIGCGRRANWAHLPGVQKHAKAQNVQFTAVCDPWRPRREQTAAKIKKWTGQAAQQFVSYRDLLAKGNVDAVMIASCDHQHTTHLEAAAKAKKDAYCEKPLAMDLEKLKRACDAVTASGICCQIGTQIRSLPTSRGCQKFFQGGLLGKLSRVEETRNAAKPYWYSRLGKANKRDVEWKEFLMDVPEQPFRADRFTGWYGYREFSDGPVPGLGSHFIDLMNYITGSKLPESCVAHGGTFTWKDEHEFTCPDQVQATWVYPEGFLVSYSTNFGSAAGNRILFSGEHGVLNLTPWDKPTVSGEGARVKGKLGEEVPIVPVEGPDHFLDWLQCMRTRRTPNAPIEAGYQHSVAVIMAMQAFDTGRRQIYNTAKREIREG